MDSKLVFRAGRPFLSTERSERPFLAYMTYFTENARYEDFAAEGYHLYSVCCYFTSLPINPWSGFTPARRGIFDRKGAPDYSEFDADVKDLLKKDPEALFFPRIYLSMPAWWVAENPTELVPTQANPEGREMLFSEKYREDGAALLREFIAHVRRSEYADAVIGYQVSGGCTQEWLHFDWHGSFCENAYPYFCKYMEEKQKGSTREMTRERFLAKEYFADYTRFANDAVADTVEHFASVCKAACGGRQIVGAFYGYCLEINEFPLCGTYSLARLLNSESIDFFCSPFSYSADRTLENDLSYMTAYHSLPLHHKAYILEADIRTHLTKYPDESRPDLTIKVQYRGAIWHGEPTEEGTLCQLRRAFAKVITGAGGLWWFDMWGGWYQSEGMMRALGALRRIAETEGGVPLPVASRVAVLIDERVYERCGTRPVHIGRELCKRLAASGFVADVYLVEDLPRIKELYSVFCFPHPAPDADTVAALRAAGKQCVSGENISCEEVISACRLAGMTPLGKAGDLYYEGNGFLSCFALSEGEKCLTLPSGYDAEPLLIGGALLREEGRLRFFLSKHDTALFRLIRA